MGVILNTNRVTSEFETSSPPSNTNYVGRGLACNMKVKPSRVCRFEHLQIPCYYGTNGHQNPPAQCIQDSMDLNKSTYTLQSISLKKKKTNFQTSLMVWCQGNHAGSIRWIGWLRGKGKVVGSIPSLTKPTFVEKKKASRITGTYISSSPKWIPTSCLTGARKKIQAFLGLGVGRSHRMHCRGTRRHRTIVPKVDQSGGTTGKSEGSIDGDLSALMGSRQSWVIIRDGSLCQCGSGICNGRSICIWGTARWYDSHQSLCSRHSWIEVVAGIDSPCNPLVCSRDSCVSEGYVQLPCGLVKGPVEVRG